MKTSVKAPGVVSIAGKYYCGAEEVKKYLGCGGNKAYEVIRTLREELIRDGKLTPEYPKGKIPRKYFLERCMIEE